MHVCDFEHQRPREVIKISMKLESALLVSSFYWGIQNLLKVVRISLEYLVDLFGLAIDS